jgi:RHS repeat-associated protein
MESRFHRIFVAAALLLLSVCFCIEGNGQTTVTYSYDSAGNRIGRSSGVGRNSSVSGSAVESAAHILSTHSAPISTLDSVQSLQNQQRKINLVKTTEEKVLHSEEYRSSLIEAEAEAFGIRSAATPRTDRSAYTVGGISLVSGITPSGARTYSIPIATAAGLKLAPSVAIGYNSQAGEGWAGYGWDIQGLPSISLVNKNIYYHGKAEAASVEDKAAAFALDGVPLVANDDLSTSATFPLETASGHILVAPAKSASGYVTGFTALYPDGVTAVFRPCQTDTCQSPSYPIAEMSDLDGNRVVFNYLPDVSGGNPRISSIQYGLNGTDACLGETVFGYNLLQYRPVRYYAGRLVRRPYRLSSIVTRSGGERTGRYSLSYEENDGVSLLTKVEYSSMTESLPPLEFEYGGGADPDSAAHIFRKNNPLFLTSSFTRDVDVHYKRGKFVRDSHTTVYGGLNPRLVRSVTTDGLTGIETAVNYSYDGYDCPTSVLTSRRAGSSAPMTESVFRTYLHNVETSRYVTGLVTEERVVKKDEGNTSPAWEERRTVAYDSLSHPRAIRRYVGETAVSGIRNDALNLVSETLLSYDGHGNMVSEMTAPYGAEEYTGDTYVYDGDGRYLLSKTGALGHTTAYGGYNRFGKPATETDYRGRVTSFTYDEFGNLVKTERPDGSEEETASVWGGAGLYTVTDTRSDGPTRSVCFDALGRETRSGTLRFDGRWQYIDREYDSEGRLGRVSLPFRGSQAVYWNTYSYDEYGRQVGLAEASGKVASWAYDGLSVTTVKDGVTSTRTTDANGGVVSVTDGGGTITYALRNDGQPSSVTAPGNAVTTFSYDGYGRRTVIDDPCAGIRTDTCVWNGDGSSVLTHTGPDGTVVTRKDKYGRTVSVERPGEYDTACSYDEYGLPSVEQSTNGVRTEYAYDDFDRISKIDESIADVILRKVYFYRPGGGLSSIMYVVGEELVATENFGYANGHNTEVTLSDSTVVRRLVSENDLGMATEVITGGISRRYGFTDFGLPVYRRMDDGDLQDFAYRFDPLTGNLLSRADSLNGRTETFGYDSLDRLTLMGRMQVGYSDNGNIVSVDGVGTMGYESSGGPYRVTSFSPEYGGLVRDRAQTVSYTSFDRPSTLAEGGRTVSFTYDGAGNRVKMHVTDEEGYELTRFYLGGRYERDQTLEGVKERLYLGGDVYSAPMVFQRLNDGGWVAYNIGRDYLGSVTHIATLDGTLVAGYSYDPWGRLRDPRTLEIYAAGEEPDLFLGRGFTGHEHLPWFGLVNMNARLYDPLLGRFLSPDPYVQTPDFTQSFNRYSYALNNPLKYTDENGEFVLTAGIITAIIVGSAIVGGTINVAANWNSINGFWQGFTSFGVGALTGGGMAALGLLTGPVSVIAGGAVAGGATSFNNDIVRQTGKNFKGIDNVDWNSVLGNTISGAAAGAAASSMGIYASGLSLSINGSVVNSPLIKSGVASILTSSTGHITSGTVYGLCKGQSISEAITNSFKGIGKSIAIGVGISLSTTISFSLANNINPINGKSLNSSGNYSVYEGIDPISGDTKYVGITKRDPHIRWHEHYNSGTERAFLDYHVVKNGLNYFDARMMEQMLINNYGLDNLYNVRNSISPKYWNKYGIKL